MLFLAVSVVATRPLAARMRSTTLAKADAAIYVWEVNWLSGHLLSPGELFEGNIFVPTRHAALLSDLALGTALLVAPLRPFLRDPLALYNVGVLVTLTFGAWAFHRLVLALTGNVGASVLAGMLAAFGSHQLLHVYQLNLVNIGFLALFLAALHRLFGPSRPWLSALLVGIAFALNGLSSAYFAVAAAVLALTFALGNLPRFRSRDFCIACAAAVAVGALLMWPYIRAFSWLQETEGLERPLEASIEQAFRPSRDLSSDAYVYRYGLGNEGQRLFPGLACLLLALVACVRRVRTWGLYLGGGAALLLLSLGPAVDFAGQQLSLPYAALFGVRPFNAMMHPYSFAAVARFCACVLAGLGFAAAAGRDTPVVRALAVVIGLAEVLSPGAAVRDIPAGVPAIYGALDSLPAGAVLDIPVEAPDAMIWAARHGKPVINGRGGVAPGAHHRLEQWMRRDWLRPIEDGQRPELDDTRAMRQLLRMPAAYVIVPSGRLPSLAPLEEGFDRSRFFERVAGAPGSDVLYRRTSVPAP
jgi:hypothetical protein